MPGFENNETEQRLRALGLSLPSPPVPAGNYVQATRVGYLLYVSGQGPSIDGKPKAVGRVGEDVTFEQAYEAARRCALNALAIAAQFAGGLAGVAGVLQVRGFVSSAETFHAQPKVIDGASDLLVAVFGDAGRHVRAALGTSSLPNNIPVEVETIFVLSESGLKFARELSTDRGI